MSSRSKGVTNVEFSRRRIWRVRSSPRRSDSTTRLCDAFESWKSSSIDRRRSAHSTALDADSSNRSKNRSSVGTSRNRKRTSDTLSYESDPVGDVDGVVAETLVEPADECQLE